MERAAAAVVLEEHAARRFVGRDAAGAHARARRIFRVVVRVALVEPARRVAERRVEDRRDDVLARQDRRLLEEVDVAAVLAASVEERAIALVAAAALVAHAVGREAADEDLFLDALEATAARAGQVEELRVFRILAHLALATST